MCACSAVCGLGQQRGVLGCHECHIRPDVVLSATPEQPGADCVMNESAEGRYVESKQRRFSLRVLADV